MSEKAGLRYRISGYRLSVGADGKQTDDERVLFRAIQGGMIL